MINFYLVFVSNPAKLPIMNEATEIPELEGPKLQAFLHLLSGLSVAKIHYTSQLSQIKIVPRYLKD